MKDFGNIDLDDNELQQHQLLWETLPGLLLSPFLHKSPVVFLKDFYNNARHLDDELAMSSIGRLLGAAELGGAAKDDAINAS